MQTSTKETESLVPTRSRLNGLHYVLACVALCALPLFALAQDDIHSAPPSPCNEFGGHHPMRDNAFSPPPMGLPLLPPQLELTDEQQEKIFELQHAQEPTIFEQERIARKTMQELQVLTKSDHFDVASAKSLADAHGKALAELIYQRTVTHAKIWSLLSEAQRKRLGDLPEGHAGPGHDHFMN